MRKWLLRGMSLFMALVVLSGTVCAVDYDPDKEHQPVDFADMVFTPYDEGPLTAALDELEALCGPECQEEDQPRAQALYETIVEEFERLDTLYSLAYIHYYASGTSQEWAEAKDTMVEQTTRLHDRIFAVLRGLADSPCRGVLDEDQGEDYTDALLEYEDMSDEMKRLIQEENRLVQQYDQVLVNGAEATIDGQVWTDKALNEADLSPEEYWDISDELDKSLNAAVGETFRQLIQVRTDIAEEAGCDSYIKYAYSCYNRDYSPREVQRLRQAVKRYFVPLNALSYDSYDNEALNNAWQSLNLEGKTLMQAIQPEITALHPALETSYDFMMTHQLYDTDLRPGKLNGGFTIGLGSYGSAYIYNKPYGTYQDCSDMVHEFGHFNQYYYDPAPALWMSSNVDTAEIHSQALELFYASSSDLFGSASDDFFYSILNDLVDSVQEGCMYDEFLAEVYDNPDLSLDEINAVFKDVSEDYGYYYPDDQEESWFWVRVHHNFQKPFYYISYAVSALSSLDLWLRSLNDWDGAVETYMDLTALSMDITFQDALEEVELADIFDRSVIKEIAGSVEDVFLEQSTDYSPASWTLHKTLSRAAYILGVMIGIVMIFSPVILIAVILFFVIRHRRRKRRQKWVY